MHRFGVLRILLLSAFLVNVVTGNVNLALEKTPDKIVEGGNITLTCVTNQTGGTYQWKLNGDLLSGENESILTIINIQHKQNSGNYSCVFNGTITLCVKSITALKMRRAAGFVIFKKLTKGTEYLLLQTSYGTHHWTPPKGKVDPGEAGLRAAYRETLEETGIGEEQLYVHKDMKFELQYQVRDEMKRVLYWLARLEDVATPVELSDEHRDFTWADVEEACQLVVYENMQKILQDAQQYLDGAI